MLRCISQELKKIFYLPYVLLSAAGILVLHLMSTGEMDETVKCITIFSLMLQGKEAAAGQIEKSALFLWKQGIGEWLNIFLPLLLTLSYIVLISEERQNGQSKFQFIRSSNLHYCISKVFSGGVFGGSVFMAAYALFGLLMMAQFPLFSGFSLDAQSFYREIYFGNSIYFYIMKRLVGAFLYGMSASVFGIGVAILFRDKYMLLCLPFLLNYMYRRILTKLLYTAVVDGESVEFIEALYPDFLMQVSWNRYWILSVFMLLLAYAVMVVLFYWSMKRSIRRGNWGE